MKRSAIRRKGRSDSDKVTDEVWNDVMRRDNFTCLARLLDPKADPCRSRWGTQFSGHAHPSQVPVVNEWLTLDHVNEQATLGKRAPSDRRHLLVLCWHHNVGSWASANRQVEREYLQGLYST